MLHFREHVQNLAVFALRADPVHERRQQAWVVRPLVLREAWLGRHVNVCDLDPFRDVNRVWTTAFYNGYPLDHVASDLHHVDKIGTSL
jgi:hypothetical protein